MITGVFIVGKKKPKPKQTPQIAASRYYRHDNKMYTLDMSSEATGENEAKSFVMQSALVSGNTKER